MFKRFPFFNQYDAMDRGPACLKIIAEFYGKKYTLNTLIEKSFYTRKGISLKGLSHAAESIGFKTLGVTTSYQRLLKENPTPFIAYWKQHHFIVVYKITSKYVWVSDPAIGKYKISSEEFTNGWDNR